jgi:hypothetical protein
MLLSMNVMYQVRVEKNIAQANYVAKELRKHKQKTQTTQM